MIAEVEAIRRETATNSQNHRLTVAYKKCMIPTNIARFSSKCDAFGRREHNADICPGGSAVTLMNAGLLEPSRVALTADVVQVARTQFRCTLVAKEINLSK